MAKGRERRPMYERKVPRHRDFNPDDPKRHNFLVHLAEIRRNLARKRARRRR